MQASYGISERRACVAFPIHRSTQRYRSRRPDQAALMMRIKELAATRVRYGYRRIHVLLRREGWAINHKRTHRLYRDLGLQLRNKTQKRRVKASCARIACHQSLRDHRPGPHYDEKSGSTARLPVGSSLRGWRELPVGRNRGKSDVLAWSHPGFDHLCLRRPGLYSRYAVHT
jgi:transposase InsO family protein